jgi:homocysteine S-methyltransferase
MTQNVFEPKILERFLDGCAKFKRPIMVGVLPLANTRHAEFLATEVPGMTIPDAVRDRMRKAGDSRGPKEGAAMARDMIALCREKAAGVYLVPSFGRYDIVADLIAETRR